MSDPIPNFGGFTDWQRNTGKRPRTDGDVDVVLRSEVRNPTAWRSDPMHPCHWRWDIDGSEDVLFWRYVNPEDAARDDLSERAARILGDKADGSPAGDLAAALDEVERLRRDLMFATTGDDERLQDAVAEERAAVVAYLGQHDDWRHWHHDRGCGAMATPDMAHAASVLAEDIRAGKHREEDSGHG